MKKYITIAALGSLLVFPAIVGAQGLQQQNRVQDPTTNVSGTPSGTQVQNQNQNAVQNKGETTQLMNSFQQMQQFAAMEGLDEAVSAQVATMAQQQSQAQSQIQTELVKLQSRSAFMKKLFGPDLGAIKNLNQQIQQNQLRIQSLQKLQTQIFNEGENTQLQNVIEALVKENTSLQSQVQAEEQVKGLFGWLVRLFNK